MNLDFKIKKFESNILIYFLSALITSGFSFLITIILTELITPKEFGIIENFISLASLITIIILFGSDTHLVKYFSENKGDHFRVILNGIFFQSLLILVLLLASSFIYPTYLLIINLIFFSIFNSFYTIIITSFQLEKNAIKYAITIISFGFLNFFLSIFLVYFFENAIARITGMTLAILIISIYSIYNFNKFEFKTLLNFKFINKEFYDIGFILFLGQFLSWIIEKSDRILVSNIDSYESAGLYGVGYQFGMIILVIQSAISRAWMPRLIENFKNNNKNKIIKDTINLSLFLIVTSLLVSLFSYLFIIHFINSAFSNSAIIAVLISVAYMIDGIWKLFNGILIYHNMYSQSTIILLSAGVSNLFLNLILIPEYGYFGAAYSTIGSFMIGLILSLYIVIFKHKFLSNE